MGRKMAINIKRRSLRSSKEVGNDYEQLAAEYLVKNGYKIIKRNYRLRSGEIDIIARKEDIISFIEVKYRKNSDYGNGLDAVTIEKQKKISKAALHFIAYNNISEKITFSFDVIDIEGEGYINHIKNAFDFIE